MVFPSISYRRDETYKRHANNNPFMAEARYEVTAMDQDPDSPIFRELEMMPKCKFVRAFARGQLNHQVFNLYF